MTSTAAARDTAPDSGGTTVGPLATKEVTRYARHPLFLVGAALTVLASVGGPDPRTSSLFHVIAPAAGLVLIGAALVAIYLVRRRLQQLNAQNTLERTGPTR